MSELDLPLNCLTHVTSWLSMSDLTIARALREALGLHQSGRLSAAESIYRRILVQQPNHADALHLLGYALFQSGQTQAAIQFIRRAIDVQPEIPAFHNNLGTVLEKAGLTEQAAAAYRTALRLDPKYVEAHSNLGNVLQTQGLLDEAIASYQAALRYDADYFPAHFNLGNLYKEHGRQDDAVACYRRAVNLSPGLSTIHSNLLLALHYQAGCSASELAVEHRLWNERHAAPLRSMVRPHRNDRDEERPLRVGYVSPDFCDHAVSRFILPLLQNHDHTRFKIFAYADVAVPDRVTDRIKACVDVWRDTVGTDDSRLADLIRHDQIDVLLDLAAHTAHGRLLAFARRPAPVQVTYLAYCSTTGLDVMDYRLTDPFLDPVGTDLGNYSERSVRLPVTYWCYSAPDLPISVGRSLARQSGPVTFGCLNNFCKITEVTLRAWGGVLRAVAGSRLLICARTESQRRWVHAALLAGGVESSRVRFVGNQRFADYMATYQEIDISLDPIPFTGGTTTCDALWMGVPVVSLAGATAVARGGSSLLSNVGLPELVAHTEDDYVRIAAELAHDRPRLALLRSGLRARLESSPVVDAIGFAQSFELVLREMWRGWCREARRR